MEEERYKIDKSTNYYTNTIVDTKTNTYYGNIEEHIDLLNQQDKRIKELENQLAEKTLTIEQINKAFIGNRSLWKGKYERANQIKQLKETMKSE